ncbi:unnamed protein product [Lymnaea stagnalis]|uniref:Asteroid domain-containing protein n=1 Tax=Lymnaea stagnalis TaxID=6523 RepID=A0AAV2HBM9_LYMST
MGVSRFWTYIMNTHRDAVVSYVDLIELAKGYPQGMKILVDFYCWEHFMTERFWNSICELTENKSLMFAGGEYKLMDEYIKSFILILRSVNIELVFYLDGAKGSAYHSSKQKLQTWKRRYLETQRNLNKCFQYLRGQVPLSGVVLRRLPRPCLQEVQNVLTLQEAGCKLYLRVSGEADFTLAQHLLADDQAFGIFSNDTDFLIFPDSVYISQELFDLDNHLGLGLKSFAPQIPEKLICGIIRTDSIMKVLNLPNHKALVELATISGNDFTLPFLVTKKVFRENYLGQFDKIASLINENGTADNCEFFGEYMAHDSNFQDAVNHSRQFYSLTLADEEEHQKGYIFNLIVDGIRRGQLPSTIVSMHLGTYWHRQILEEPGPHLPGAEETLSTLRSYVYKLVLPPDRHEIVEIGRSSQQLMNETRVKKAENVRIPSLAQVRKNSFSANVCLFEIIIQHQEPQAMMKGRSYFKLYGMRMGFLCYLLRYFLKLNWQRNLYLHPEEFFVLAAWTMACHEPRRFHLFKFVPSVRCVTVENWFQALYRHAYAFLGNVLGIAHEFPTPKELFSGGTFVALYMSCSILAVNQEARQRLPENVSLEDLKQVKGLVQQIVMDNRLILRQVIHGLFPFDGC